MKASGQMRRAVHVSVRTVSASAVSGWSDASAAPIRSRSMPARSQSRVATATDACQVAARQPPCTACKLASGEPECKHSLPYDARAKPF